uniref:non-specific serine/threonine protein kinase n=1 Tax=Petromyzon marinus TaxID=7757 RepID=S4RG12_PETMA
GRFGVVRKCVEVSTGREFAAKFVRKRRKGQDLRAEIIHEVAILELAHGNPHVIGLHRVYETAGEIILVLEYPIGSETLQQCVAEREEAFTERDVVRLMTQILDGVAFLHRKSVVHLDLK